LACRQATEHFPEHASESLFHIMGYYMPQARTKTDFQTDQSSIANSTFFAAAANKTEDWATMQNRSDWDTFAALRANKRARTAFALDHPSRVAYLDIFSSSLIRCCCLL
jgi:hypothetical protein